MIAYFRTVIIVVAIVLIGVGGLYYWKNLRGAGPAFLPPPEDITTLLPSTNSPETGDEVPSPGAPVSAPSNPPPAQNTTGMPLKLPAGFSISIFAKGLTTPRVMAFDSGGNLWVSEMNAGAVTLIETESGKAIRQNRVFRSLKRPHGLAFDPADPNMLFIAEENRISRVPLGAEAGLETIVDLPSGGRHFSRTIGFGPDGRLYVSIGSSCDVCNEEDARRAAVYSMNKDGADFKLFANGLRNTVFFTWHPETKEMWGTDMGRDFLGDNLPPDEINIIKEGRPVADALRRSGVNDYGWPYCYGDNVVDEKFDSSRDAHARCANAVPSHIDLPAHVAPLGLAFIPRNSNWPQEYWGDVLVAYHGSWNRSEPTGYKVVRMKLDEAGRHEGTEDFITGWLVKGGALGRPVDLKFDMQGALFISDDKAGVIYKVTYASG